MLTFSKSKTYKKFVKLLQNDLKNDIMNLQ